MIDKIMQLAQIPSIIKRSQEIANQYGIVEGMSIACQEAGISKQQAMSMINQHQNNPVVQEQLRKYGVDINGVKEALGGASYTASKDLSKYDI